MTQFLAFDLGAESGRAVVGHLNDGKLSLEVIHRFSNGPVRVGDSLHWDVLRLWSEIKAGLTIAVKQYDDICSLGLDTWGVDFGLLDKDDVLLGNPYHYRDRRTDGMMEAAFERVPRAEIYDLTGIQFLQLNTLYQLLAMAQADAPALSVAHTFLTMPDLLNFWLTGRKASEFTIATTTQCYDPRAGDWAYDLLQRLGIPTQMFGPILQPGEVLGYLLPSVQEETGAGAIPVVATATHDTGSAVAAVPATGQDYIYLSSGTWSLMGVESQVPLINEDMLQFNLTNEGGFNNTFRVLKNIMGLWLVQECRREWARQGHEYSYEQLTQMAAEASETGVSDGPLVWVDDPRFLAPGDMVGRIQDFCRETGQSVPHSKGEILRCTLESLALEYRWVAESLDRLTGKRLNTIHIIGGGSQNRLLNQFAADATGRTIVAGPVEATAIGNLLVQAIAMGEIESLEEGRRIVAQSFDVETFTSGDAAMWDAAYRRYLELKREHSSM